MTDRYENIRKALEMGPAPGPYKQSEFTPQRVDTRSGSINVAWYCNFDNGAREAEAEATAAHIAACDPDTIRELLAERDAAVAIVAELCSSREGMTMLAGLVCRKMDQVGEIIDAAIAAANGGGNG